ncbi:MAG: hypothetical protein AVDCRST_MAG64-2857, partial [uncultured Phycisphaerae bacterium]
ESSPRHASAGDVAVGPHRRRPAARQPQAAPGPGRAHGAGRHRRELRDPDARPVVQRGVVPAEGLARRRPALHAHDPRPRPGRRHARVRGRALPRAVERQARDGRAVPDV